MPFTLLDDQPEDAGGFKLLDDRQDPKIGKPEALTFGEKVMSGVSLPNWMDKLISRGVRPIVQGMADPVIGAAQTIANVLPDSTGIPGAVNKGVADENARYELERKSSGGEGVDLGRAAGNVLSPTNLLIASKLPVALSAGARALQGAAVGAGGGAMAPVENAADGFWKQKAAQVGVGAVTGGVLTPVLGKVADIAVRRFGATPNVRASSHDIDGAIMDALKDVGQSIDDVPPDQLAALRTQVQSALGKGQTLDTAAALRKADFEALKMQPLQGQITRDPAQFAREQNLRGVDGIGEPIMARLQDQSGKLQTALPAGGAKNAYQAGTQLSESLAGVDDKLSRHVSGLYGDARASTGKDLLMPTDSVLSGYKQVVTDFEDKVPKAVQSKFDRLGFQFSFEDADKLRKAINEHVGSDPVTNRALGKLRALVDSAQTNADTAGGPFAPAVKAASERFKLHEAVPALKAASQGSVAPDDFVRRFVVNGKTNEVKGLAQVLKQSDPEAFQEAQAQLADELRRAAFGEVNGVTGDSPFAPARYMATIRRIGPDKLGAFFTPEQVADIMRVGRVGAYIKSAPNAAPVNSSNTTSAAANLLMKLPGLRQAGAVINNVVRPIQNSNALRDALNAEIPRTAAPLSPEQENFLAYLLAAGGLGVGASAARSQ